MAWTRLSMLALLGLILSACVSSADLALWSEGANRTMRCQVGPECDAMWGRAIHWISQHSKWRFQQQTDFLISTYGSTDTNPSYQVTKTPLGDGTARINVSIGCGNMFGCTPHVLKAKSDLVTFILGAQQSNLAAASPPGMRSRPIRSEWLRTGEATLHTGPGGDFQVITVLRAPVLVDVFEERGQWERVRVPSLDDREGWIDGTLTEGRAPSSRELEAEDSPQ